MLILVLTCTGTAGAARLITGKQVKNNSLTGADLKNGSVRLADLSSSPKATPKGAAGPKGDSGPKGDRGAPGAKGDPGAAGPAAGLMGRMTSLATDTIHTEYGYVGAPGSASDNAAMRTTLTPDVELRATKLAVQLDAAPGGTSTRSFRLRVNGDPSPLFCLVSGAATTCESGAAVTIPPLSEITLLTLSGLQAPASANAIYSVTVERP
jgi:hypothetical protein